MRKIYLIIFILTIFTIIMVFSFNSCGNSDYEPYDDYFDNDFLEDVDDSFDNTVTEIVIEETLDETEIESPILEQDSNEITLSFSSSDYEDRQYTDALRDFETAGFTNIKLEVIYDLVTGWFTSDGEIEEVLINGSSLFSKGEIYPKDSEIVIVYHTWESNEPQITMPNYSWHYDEGWSVEELIDHFEQLGFTNIETATTIDSGMFSEFHQEGEIYNVEIEDTLLGGWNSGDAFDATSLITITYYERTPTLTVDNCRDLATVLSCKDMIYTDFAEKYDGQFIEFDACISSFVYDVTGKVVSISVCGGDIASNTFDNSDIEGYAIRLDTELTAGNEANIHTNFEKGTKVKVVAKVDDYHTDYYKSICAKAAYVTER